MALSTTKLADNPTNLADDVTGANGFHPSSVGRTEDDDLDAALAAGRRRRRWPWLLVGAGLGVGGTFATAQLLETSASDGEVTLTETVGLSTAPVEMRDLIDVIEYPAQLSSGGSESILSGVDGVLTSVAAAGDTLERGSVVATIDAEPVVAFYGSQPFWRDLESGDEGSDVLQLEANLSALGFDDGGEMSVDHDYTSSTAAAVEAWEESFGLEPTGEFQVGRAVVLNGPSLVSETSDPGSPARVGEQILLVQSQLSVVDVTFEGDDLEDDAVLDDLIVLGTPVVHGTTLATIDGLAVQAMTDISDSSELILDAMSANDSERLESLLVFFGFDPDGAIVPDDEIDLATAAAITRWQESIDLAATGVIGGSYYVVVPSGHLVETIYLIDGSTVNGGVLAMTLSESTLSINADIAVDEIDEFEVGKAVGVELADGTLHAAEVTAIAEVAAAPPTDGQADGDSTTVAVTIELLDPPDDVLFGPVLITIETGRIANATVVPTRALISLSEGGFAVEVVSSNGNELASVELGAFDDGLVEVVGGGVQPGDVVVVPT